MEKVTLTLVGFFENTTKNKNTDDIFIKINLNYKILSFYKTNFFVNFPQSFICKI